MAAPWSCCLLAVLVLMSVIESESRVARKDLGKNKEKYANQKQV